jgi:exodeoxyribonuclease-3
MSLLTLATWNVNGIRARFGQLHDWLARDHPDIVCLQELKASPDQIPGGLFEMEGYWSYWHGGKGYSGVSLHVAKTVCPDCPAFAHPDFDFEHRIVTADVNGVRVASVYVPNGGRDFPGKMRFLEALNAYAERGRAEGLTLVICGDLNVARTERDVHPKERKPRAIGQLPEERAMIERLIGHGLVDVGRTLDPDNDGLFTWWAPWRDMRARNIGWRLDYVLASTTLNARACTVLKDIGTSDHAPVIAMFE